MSRRLWISLLLLPAALSAASLLGVPGPGRMTESPDVVRRGMAGAGEAMVDKVNFSTRAPARNAFNDKTAFTFGARYENSLAQWGGKEEALEDFSFESIGLGTPIGWLGALSLTYHPLASRYLEVVDEKRGNSLLTGSLQELVVSWSVRAPFERRLSLGVSWREAIGMERTLLDWKLTDSEKEAINLRTTLELEQRTRSSGGRPSASLFWLGKRVSMAAWWAPEFDLERDYDRSAHLVELMGVHGYSSAVYAEDRPGELNANRLESWKQSLPWNGGAALSLRLTRLQSLHFDFHQESWSTIDGWRVVEPFGPATNLPLETSRRVSVGWAYEGSDRSFDPFWKRAQYRAGGRWVDLENPGMQEVAGALGCSFPLGRRGALVDLAAEGGRRYSDNGSTPDESFIAFSFGVTGLSQWGQPTRRR